MGEFMPFGEDIWVMDGPMVWDTGFLFATRMTIIRLPDGSIWIESPVPVSFEAMRRISEIGPVRYLLASTPRHAWRLSGWHALFPEARMWTSPPTLFSVGRRAVPMAGVLTSQPPIEWGGALEQLIFRGNPLLNEVVFLHKRSRTVVMGDLLGTNTAPESMRLQGAIFRLQGLPPGRIGTGLDMRLTFFNRKAARESLQLLLSWDFDKLVIAHGECIRQDAKSLVESAFRWLR